MNPVRKILVGGTLAATTLAGGALGAALINSSASAATSSTTTPAASSSAQPPAQAPSFDPTKGGHQANGITETLLTGDTATKAKDAALAAVPGGTIQRVETDAEGAVYEAHMLKSDGSPVTVKMDAAFKVTGIETGPGGPGGGHGRFGGQPAQQPSTQQNG